MPTRVVSLLDCDADGDDPGGSPLAAVRAWPALLRPAGWGIPSALAVLLAGAALAAAGVAVAAAGRAGLAAGPPLRVAVSLFVVLLVAGSLLSREPAAGSESGRATEVLGLDRLDLDRAVDHLAGGHFGGPHGTSMGEVVVAPVGGDAAGLRELPGRLADRRREAQLHPILVGVAGTDPTAVDATLRAYETGLVVEARRAEHVKAFLELLPRAWDDLDRGALSGYGSATIRRIDVDDTRVDDPAVYEDVAGRRGLALHPTAREYPPGPILLRAPPRFVDPAREVLADGERTLVAVPDEDARAITVLGLRLAEDPGFDAGEREGPDGAAIRSREDLALARRREGPGDLPLVGTMDAGFGVAGNDR